MCGNFSLLSKYKLLCKVPWYPVHAMALEQKSILDNLGEEVTGEAVASAENYQSP